MLSSEIMKFKDGGYLIGDNHIVNENYASSGAFAFET